jgi:hypothetical protein
MKANRRAAHKVFNCAIKGDWDTWRKLYDKLTIDDLIWINMAIDGIIRDQICKTARGIKAAFGKIEEETLRVVELGCYRGGLAADMLKHFPAMIESWTGYDINYYAVGDPIPIDKRYKAVKQTKWFYDVDFGPEPNTFVSTSTLEHHNRLQVVKILGKVAESDQIKYIIIGLPLDPRGWWGYNGSHILDMGRQEITQMLENFGFDIFYNEKHRVYVWGGRKR